MKRTILFLLTAVLIISFTACTADPPNPPPETTIPTHNAESSD